MLRIEFEQNLAANEQTGPINREMRHLITSLQNHNQQLKGENNRLKKKLKESSHEITKLRHTLDHREEKPKEKESTSAANVDKQSETKPLVGSESTNAIKEEPNIKEEIHDLTEIKKEKVYSFNSFLFSNIFELQVDSKASASQAVATTQSTPVQSTPQAHHSVGNPNPHHSHHKHHHSQHVLKKEGTDSDQSLIESDVKVERRSESDLIREIRDLKTQLKNSVGAQRELKLLLDMFKSVDKDKRFVNN